MPEQFQNAFSRRHAAIDPTYEGVYDKLNSSFIGKGIVLLKYTGARGKSGGK